MATTSPTPKAKPSSLASLPAPASSRSASNSSSSDGAARGQGAPSVTAAQRAVADVKDVKTTKASDDASRLSSLETQMAQILRILSAKKAIADSDAVAASATVSEPAGDSKDLLAKAEEASRPTSSVGRAAKAVVEPASTVNEPALPDDGDDDLAGSAAAVASPSSKRLGAGILTAAQQHGSFRAWCRNVEWKVLRNKHEAATLAAALDLLLRDGVAAELDGMETLMRRLAALQLADATRQYTVIETMAYQPFGGASLLAPDVVDRELSKASRLQKLMQSQPASTNFAGRGGAGRGRAVGKRGGLGRGGVGGAPSSGAARDQ